MSDLLTVRYPSGATEFRMSDKAPAVGDVLARDGGEWIVQEVTEANGTTHVTLRPSTPGAEPVTEPQPEPA